MKGSLRSRDGIISISRRHPAWARPFVRFFLGRCGECPSRILCLEDALGGDGELLYALTAFNCENHTSAGRVATEIARFASSRCFKCGSRSACEQYLGNHVLKVSATDKEMWPVAKDLIEGLVDRCGSCPLLPGCTQGALDDVGGVPLILLRHIWIRFECLIGAR